MESIKIIRIRCICTIYSGCRYTINIYPPAIIICLITNNRWRAFVYIDTASITCSIVTDNIVHLDNGSTFVHVNSTTIGCVSILDCKSLYS